MEPPSTATLILDAAQELVQVRGYNAFSYREIAARVGIRAATIHYYFPTKGDLGQALMARFGRAVGEAQAGIDARHKDPRRKLEAYVQLFQHALDDGNRMCLGGMLAMEHATLPESVQAEVRRFVDANEAWIAAVLEQ